MTKDKKPLPIKNIIFAKRRAAFLACALLLVMAPSPARAGSSAPDYARSKAWLSRPSAPAHGVAVFFIHPTSYLLPVTGNARYNHGGLVARMDKGVMRFQAGVFSACCDIWAPEYRQASLKAITANNAQAYAADNIAYGDIARAFGVFVSNLHGRPFILASHSQGSIHALRLLQQQILGTKLQRRLVAAYLPGLALPQTIAARGLPVCPNAAATGCVVSWNTVRAGYDDKRRRTEAVIWWDGRYQPVSGRPLVCVNPLDWRIGGDVASPGAVSVYAARRGGPPSAPVAALESASCQKDGLLGITVKPDYQSRFTDILSRIGIYHDFDYNLFFASIARNAGQRIESFKPHG